MRFINFDFVDVRGAKPYWQFWRGALMSWMPGNHPDDVVFEAGPSKTELVIHARPRDLGGFSVRRVLPSLHRRLIGPFIFFDHMGPAEFPPGHGIDVRPHPHISLATVTYLFEGEIVHKDSLGSDQPIRPGDVNWMTAGRGIVHSERTGTETRERGSRLHGIQLWVALPESEEESEPRFEHYPASSIPKVTRENVELRVVAGTAYGETSPARTLSRMFYVDAAMKKGSSLLLPDEYQERAAYVVSGSVEANGETFGEGTMIVASSNGPRGSSRSPFRLDAQEDARVMLLGGEPLDGERHVWWNFVSSSPERIEKAKRDWREGHFPVVPGDAEEFIPLPS